MPERDPVQSSALAIEVLRLVIERLALPRSTPVEQRRIQQVLRDLRHRRLLDLGYVFVWSTVTKCWYSEQLSLDLNHIHIMRDIGPPMPIFHKNVRLSEKVVKVLDRYNLKGRRKNRRTVPSRPSTTRR